jgi:GT2 family glycosyltransferase
LSENLISNPLFEKNKVNYKSVASARNSFVIPIEADYIFFCDDDGYPCEDYSEILQNLIKKFPEIEIFAGSIIREDTNEFYSLRHKKGGSLSKFRNTKNLMGSNFVVKASTFENLNRFDASFGVGSFWGSSEETDFCWKAFFNKVPMDYFPELKVYHIPPFNESIKIGFKKAFKYGIGKGALVFKWLVLEKKLIVVYEFCEMLIIPFFYMFRGLIILKPQITINNFGILFGRIYGFFKAIFVRQ